MKHFIATYDIEAAPGDPHNRFLDAAVARGWSDTLTVGDRSERLPNSTLIGSFRNLDDAHRSFEAAIIDANETMSPARLNVERRYIVERASGGRLLARKTEWVKTNIARLNSMLRPKKMRVEGRDAK
ncbi:hypothetical protein [Bosea sp. Root381]|uniref:hypothetical protein n=1 Tax=Bosea sp. Root381 TaxID=1736524 RepID=UPI0012E35AC0|nr:hypothetical protein [Bosea sp. Root381]